MRFSVGGESSPSRVEPSQRIGAVWALLAVVWAAALPGCRGLGQQEPTEALATYRDGAVTRAELERFLATRASKGPRGRRLDAATRNRTLREIGAREILLAEATPPGEVLRRIGEAVADEVYEEAMRERLGWNRVEISDAEARAYYAEHRAELGRPERLRLQHIFLRAESEALDPSAREAARARIEAIRRQALAGRDFGDLARQFSDSADGSAGGWMMLERGARAVKAFADVAWKLEKGEIGEVVESASGFHLAKLDSRTPAIAPPFEEAREAVVDRLRAASSARMESEYLAETGPRYGFERHYSMLHDRDVADDAVLFRLGGESYTLATMLEELPERKYLPQYYGGYFARIEGFLDGEALRRILVKEARREEAANPRLGTRVSQAMWSAQTSHLLERRLELWAQALDEAVLWEHYEQGKALYQSPRLRSVSVIRLPRSRAENLWVTVARAERLAKEIRSGADFGEIARRESHHVSSRAGGRLVDFTDDELAVQIHGWMRGQRVVDGLEVGEISEPYIGEVYDSDGGRHVSTGVYIVRLDAETPIRQASFRDAKDRVRASYLRRHRAAALEAVVEETLAHWEFRVLTK